MTIDMCKMVNLLVIIMIIFSHAYQNHAWITSINKCLVMLNKNAWFLKNALASDNYENWQSRTCTTCARKRVTCTLFEAVNHTNNN